MNELKPCPFCGGEAEILTRGTSKCSTMYACTDCSAQLETSEEFNHGARWNTRPIEDALTAELAKTKEKLGVAKDALQDLGKCGTWHEVCRAWDTKGENALAELNNIKDE